MMILSLRLFFSVSTGNIAMGNPWQKNNEDVFHSWTAMGDTYFWLDIIVNVTGQQNGMFNVPSFDCICLAWKVWVNRLVPGSSQHSEERAKRGKMRKHNGHASSLHPGEDDTDKNESSTRNRHSWHVSSTSDTCNTALSFDQTSLEGFPGDPHSGSNGVPHGWLQKILARDISH